MRSTLAAGERIQIAGEAVGQRAEREKKSYCGDITLGLSAFSTNPLREKNNQLLTGAAGLGCAQIGRSWSSAVRGLAIRRSAGAGAQLRRAWLCGAWASCTIERRGTRGLTGWSSAVRRSGL